MQSRYTPVGALLQLQHQANHYKNILNPRKVTSYTASKQGSRKKIYSSYLQSKFEKQRLESIKRQNVRIIKDCTQIYHKKGLLQRAQDQFIQTGHDPKPSLVNPYKAKEKYEQIRKQNKSFRRKMQTLRPLVGEKQEWKKHESFTNQIIAKLRNEKNVQKFSPDKILNIVLTSEKEKASYFKMFKTISFDKRDSKKQAEIQSENRRLQINTVRQKRRTKRKRSKKQPRSSSLDRQKNQLSMTSDLTATFNKIDCQTQKQPQ